MVFGLYSGSTESLDPPSLIQSRSLGFVNQNTSKLRDVMSKFDETSWISAKMYERSHTYVT